MNTSLSDIANAGLAVLLIYYVLMGLKWIVGLVAVYGLMWYIYHIIMTS